MNSHANSDNRKLNILSESESRHAVRGTGSCEYKVMGTGQVTIKTMAGSTITIPLMTAPAVIHIEHADDLDSIAISIDRTEHRVSAD